MNRLNPVTALLTTTRDLAFGEGLRITAAFEVSAAFTLSTSTVLEIFSTAAEASSLVEPAREDGVIDARGVYKKLCRDLRRSRWYGVRDVLDALTMRPSHSESCREHEFWAVNDVSFQLRRGDALGVLGRNGSGKSTLLENP